MYGEYHGNKLNFGSPASTLEIYSEIEVTEMRGQTRPQQRSDRAAGGCRMHVRRK